MRLRLAAFGTGVGLLIRPRVGVHAAHLLCERSSVLLFVLLFRAWCGSRPKYSDGRRNLSKPGRPCTPPVSRQRGRGVSGLCGLPVASYLMVYYYYRMATCVPGDLVSQSVVWTDTQRARQLWKQIDVCGGVWRCLPPACGWCEKCGGRTLFSSPLVTKTAATRARCSLHSLCAYRLEAAYWSDAPQLERQRKASRAS